ncbi:TPA: DNA cytosine methyltransferase [Pseudomonas aeruginosa]|uniref:DNA cytosine methyltransferase n=1 Tax=Pseudomonas aeruginosa TaxID=287 RepID=UPI0009413E5A|nr:DNA cytosine methyltransferase [Pseudomonas aeruginosa]MBI8678082.1 DNA cytosine methyltransferase [Pseudomonas aeruginosa]MCS8217435.1 DNA cytosine methyltransferase [Pseudomonas aeruginosa]MCS8824381.1 DNA cytosine methyltransferase [Pseudomonas aeruginosa]OKR69729.1 DNA (cytosine-5-)-methyltransferase [Pseudomonas aeruginosa]RPW44828.1 DNA cytosine methyltransferase [Pseudomonas aeruginosa]
MDSAHTKPLILDLFCGCGGFSLGAELAGFHSIAAIDIDPTLQSAYKRNFPNTKAVEGNVSEIQTSDWRQLIGAIRPAGIIGGPPCQGFSRIGKRQKDDPRNNLVHHFYRHVRELRPKFFVMENVQGLLDEENIETLMTGIDQVSDRYTILGPFVINAASYGAATNRLRVIVVGYDKEDVNKITVDNFIGKKKPSSIADAISDLPSPIPDFKDPSSFGWAQYPNLQTSLSSYASAMRKLPPKGLGSREAIDYLKQGYVSGLLETKHTEAVAKRYKNTANGKVDLVSKSYKLSWTGVSPTLRAGTGSDKGSFQAVRPLHPEEGRVITVREAARIQGFPDWFTFHPTKWHSFRMIGNSVSPIVSRAILSAIKKSLMEDVAKSAA